MGYEQSVLRRATARLEAQRKAREEAQERLRSEIYAKLPRVAAIDRELRRTITQIIAASLRDGSDPVPAIGVIRDKNLSLQAEKAALLTEHGYPADALDDKPACPKCSDTGWVGANMCACLKALCTEEQIRELSKLLDLGEQSFDSFSLDYYSPLPWPGESLSPRENMEFIFDVCSSYARKFGRFYFRNLFLTGAPGLGKTFLSACIARTVSESGFSVVYDTAVNIFTRFEEQKFARDRLEAGEAKDETRRYLGCDLLILDDLGSELSTPFVQSALYTLINTRLTADKRTVISSNLTMEELADHVSLNLSYFIRCFKKETGMTPHSYLISIRLQQAVYYLKTTDRTVKDIGFACGFQSENSFCITFKKHKGYTPSEYRSLPH